MPIILPSVSCILPSSPDPYSQLNDAERLAISQRRAIVDAWLEVRAQFRSLDQPLAIADAAFLAGHPGLSRGTLYRWSNLKASGDPLALLDRRRDNGRHAAEAAAAAIGEEAWKYFLSIWLTIHRRSVSLCHQVVSARTEEHAGDPAWHWPGLATVRRRANAVPAVQREHGRLGEREWKRHYEPKISRDFSKYRAHEYWVGDFHEWDIFCRRSQSDWTIVRPLLSAFLDLRSRYCPAWIIGEFETQDAVLLALRAGIEKYGPPANVVIDNGKPYRALGISGGRPRHYQKIRDEGYVRSVLGGMEIAVHFTIPFNPDSKLIEPWFGTVEEQFGCLLNSYCGNEKDDRFKLAWKLAQDHPERCPTVDELRQWFGQWLDAHLSYPHGGDGMDGMSPAEALERCDPIARAIVPAGSLDVLLMRSTKPVTCDRNGVMYQGIRYGSYDDRLRILVGQKVVLRVHPQDASFVLVCDLRGTPLFQATNNRLAANGVEREHIAEGMRAKKRAKTLARQIRAGLAKPAQEDLVTAAIRARHKAGEKLRQRQRATGTDGRGSGGNGDCPHSLAREAAPGTVPIASSRGVRPLRSDLTGPMAAFNRTRVRDRLAPPPQDPQEQPERPFSFAELGEPESAGNDDDLGPISFAENTGGEDAIGA